MPSIKSKLCRVDPYAGFDRRAYPVDMQGWGSTHPFFKSVIEAVRPSVIIEVGSWKGGSAIHMANIVKRLGLATELVCVDTWLGSTEHFLHETQFDNSLNQRHGYPSLYYTFLSNVVAAGMQEVIVPLPNSSDNAVIILKALGIEAGVIYIDAAHSLDAAYHDIAAYWDLLTEDGIMICDDYGYSEVTGAVTSFAGKVQRPVYASYGKALIPKKANRAFHLNLERIDP